MALPEYFCWTRFGTEAGQSVHHIFDRKEQERKANGGTFFWGIGNAIGPSVRELLRFTASPEVLFSPIKGSPRTADASPDAVVAWTSAETLEGDSFALPQCSMVTSRYDPAFPRGSHYALVCFSERPLNRARSEDKIVFAGLRNLKTGRPVAASQVTAVVQRKAARYFIAPVYEVIIRAKLVFPYFLRLREPQVLSKTGGDCSWAKAVSQTWEQRKSGVSQLSCARRCD
jgi:hypothetical protein